MGGEQFCTMLRVTYQGAPPRADLAARARVLATSRAVVAFAITGTEVVVVLALHERLLVHVAVGEQGVPLVLAPSLREGDGLAVDGAVLRNAEASLVTSTRSALVVLGLTLHHVVVRVDDVASAEGVDRTQEQVLHRVWCRHDASWCRAIISYCGETSTGVKV